MKKEQVAEEKLRIFLKSTGNRRNDKISKKSMSNCRKDKNNKKRT